MKFEDIKVGNVVRLLDTAVGWSPRLYNKDFKIVKNWVSAEDCTISIHSVRNNRHDFTLVVPEFDIIRDTWFIRTPTKEDMVSVQKWLFSQGLTWRSGGTEIKEYECKYLSGDRGLNTFGYGTDLDSIAEDYEIKLRTVMDVQLIDKAAIQREKDIESYQAKIKALNDEAAILQAALDKLKQG